MSAGMMAVLLGQIPRSSGGREHTRTPNTPKDRGQNRHQALIEAGSNAPSAHKGFCEFVFVNDGLEVIGVSL